jgi:hypothetical protein
LSAEIEAVMANNTKQAGPVFEGEADVPKPKFELRLDDFAICLDEIDKFEIRETFLAVVQGVPLSMRFNVNPSIQKMGEVIFLVDANNGKPIYTFAFQAHAASASLAGPLEGRQRYGPYGDCPSARRSGHA